MQNITDTNVNTCSSSVTHTVQDTTVTTRLSEDKTDDDDTTPDESLHQQDNNSARTSGNVESISVSSVEFVDIVSGEFEVLKFSFIVDSFHTTIN